MSTDINSQTKGHVDLESSHGSALRLVTNQCLSSLCIGLSFATLIPLFSIVYFILWHGLPHLTWTVLTSKQPEAGTSTGGIGNALIGTALMVVMALGIAAPMGILAAIFSAEYEPNSQVAKWMRFSANLLTGIPSIICGVFAYAVLVIPMHTSSALAGAVALSILALPTIYVTAEQSFLGVPRAFREGAYGLGATKFQTIFRTVLPEALPGIMTGLMLAMARAAGETAPLICTAGTSQFWDSSPFRPVASLSILINTLAPSSFDYQRDIAWTASLVLVSLVTITNVTAQMVFSKRH